MKRQIINGTALDIYEPNLVGRDMVCGDVHQCWSKLQDQLDELNFDETKDRLFSCGDETDRGPDWRLTLDYMAKPWYHSVMANHTQMAIDWYDAQEGQGRPSMYGCESSWRYISNGGEWYLELTQEQRKPYYEAFKGLPHRIQITSKGCPVHGPNPIGGECTCTGIVHAQASSDWLKPDDTFTMTWERFRISQGDETGTKNIGQVFLGHTPVKQPLSLGNNRYIDTGAYYGHDFTIEEL